MKSVEETLIERYGVVMEPTDVAKELHCHPTHVRTMCVSGELPAVKIGKRWRIPTKKLAALLDVD